MRKHTDDMASTDDAVDLVENEDRELGRLFADVHTLRGSEEVVDRAEYGNLAKEIIRRVSIREAALEEVVRVAETVPECEQCAARIRESAPRRRSMLDRLESMSRGVQGINLNTGQDFDGSLQELIEVLSSEMQWDLEDALPHLRTGLERSANSEEVRSAEHVAKHAPNNLSPDGPRWHERAPLVSRFVTVYDRLRDFPIALKHRMANGERRET